MFHRNVSRLHQLHPITALKSASNTAPCKCVQDLIISNNHLDLKSYPPLCRSDYKCPMCQRKNVAPAKQITWKWSLSSDKHYSLYSSLNITVISSRMLRWYTAMTAYKFSNGTFQDVIWYTVKCVTTVLGESGWKDGRSNC
jgi:hypothetical protein